MIKTLLERVDLSILSEVLLYGDVPEEQADPASCEDKLKAAESEMQQQLDDLALEPRTNEEAQDIISGYQAKISPIYFELGMMAGVKLYRALVEGETEAIKQRTYYLSKTPK